MAQSQPTGQFSAYSQGPSSANVLGADVGTTQKGVLLIQSHAPLVQPTIVSLSKCKSTSNQDTDESSFSKTLAKKGKNIPKKILIDKSKEEASMVNPIINVPQVQILPPTPLDTIVEKTEKLELMADPIIEQPIEKALDLETIDISGPQTESTENTIDISVSLSEDCKAITGQKVSTSHVFEAEAATEPTAGNELVNLEEPKEDTKPELLEEDKSTTGASDITHVEEIEKEESISDPLAKEGTAENTIDVSLSVAEDCTEVIGLEPTTDASGITHAEEIAKHVLVEDDSAEMNQNDPNESKKTMNEGIASSERAPVDENSSDKEDEKTTQDEVTQVNNEPSDTTVIEPNVLESNIIEENQEASPNLDDEVAISNDKMVDQKDSESPLETDATPLDNGLKKNEVNQDLGTTEYSTEEQNAGIDEDTEAFLVTDSDLQESADRHDLETAEESAVGTNGNVTSEVGEENPEPIVDDTEETHANQSLEVTEDTREAEDMASQIEGEKVDMDQPENKEELVTEKENIFNDAEQDGQDTDTTVTDEELSHQDDQPMVTNAEEDTSKQENVSSSFQEVEEDNIASEQSTSVKEHGNEEDEASEDITENQDIEECTVENSNDASVETEEEPVQDLEISESQIEDLVETLEENNTPLDEDKQDNEQPLVEGASDDVSPALEAADEENLVDNEATLKEVAPVEQQGASTDNRDIDVNSGSMSDQEQGRTLEDNVKDEESPVEDQDCIVEKNVQNNIEQEVVATQENPSNDQNVQDEKTAEATIPEND